MKTDTAIHRVPSWLLCLFAPICVLAGLGIMTRGAIFASPGGVAIGGALAFTAGVAAAAADPARSAQNVAIAAFFLMVLAATYSIILPALAGPAAPGMRGGPAVDGPSPRGGPGIYPPR